MVAVATIVYTEVLDLGDVKKYQPKIVSVQFFNSSCLGKTEKLMLTE